MVAPLKSAWWTPFREVDEVVVLHADLRPNPAKESEAFAWLDEGERHRWGRYLYDGPRRRFALCRAALRAALCDQLGCSNEQLAFGTFEFGKPFAVLHGEMAAVSFNVSHSGDHGLIAYAKDGWLGVDVEERVSRNNLDGLVESALSPVEQAELASADDQVRLHEFFKLWTIKESLIKAVGLGISMSMSDLVVPTEMRQGAKGGVFQLPQTPEVSWRLEDLGIESFAASVAHEVAPGRGLTVLTSS